MLVVRSYGRTVGHVSDCLVLGYLLEQDQHIVLDIGIAAVHPYIIGAHPYVVGFRGDSLLALDCRPEGALVQQGGFVQPRGYFWAGYGCPSQSPCPNCRYTGMVPRVADCFHPLLFTKTASTRYDRYKEAIDAYRSGS